MAKDKTPKTAKTPVVDKIPKAEELQNYKKLYPAWRVSSLDIDGKWGYNSFKDIVSFCISDDLYKMLDENGFVDLYCALDDIAKKKELTIGQFLKKLGQAKVEVPSDILCELSHCIDRSYYINSLHKKLAEFEGKTWDAIEKETTGKDGRSKHHDIKISKLIPEAQKRLKMLNINDIDELFSLRLEGELRVFGIRKHNVLNILWVDREHEVYKSSKKHT